MPSGTEFRKRLRENAEFAAFYAVLRRAELFTAGCKPGALPTELRPQNGATYYFVSLFRFRMLNGPACSFHPSSLICTGFTVEIRQTSTLIRDETGTAETTPEATINHR